MGNKSTIEWTDASWTPIRARVKPNAGEIAKAKNYTSLIQIATDMAGHVGPHCERVSPGCEHCYSETNNGRCLPNNGTGLPFDRRARDLVDIFIDENILQQPLKWRTPKRVFVCNQTDLFGEWVTDEMIDRVFAVMALCPQHTFQVLSKRAERMQEYLPALGLRARIAREANALMRSNKRAGDSDALASIFTWGRLKHAEPGEYVNYLAGIADRSWPLPNVWLGVSVENQEQADKRIPLLLQTPTAAGWISAEPLLDCVTLQFGWLNTGPGSSLHRDHNNWSERGLDWVVVGGESGPGARPFNIQWARAIVNQCRAARVPVFVKQLGANPFLKIEQGPIDNGTVKCGSLSYESTVALRDRKGGDINEWPSDLRVREYPEARG